MTTVWLNKRTGCKSPRCRHCKCQDGLSLVESQSLEKSEKADRPSFETQVRRPTGTCVVALLRELGKVVGLRRRKTAAAVGS